MPPVSTTPAAKLPPLSTAPAANLPWVSTTPGANFSTNFASVVDTGTLLEHASNRFDEGFEDGLRRCLAECRINFKDFLFASKFRGFRVIDPSPALPGNNDDIWDWDPVHPTAAGYENICDLIDEEFDKFSLGGSKKRPAEAQLAQETKKRPRRPASLASCRHLKLNLKAKN